MAKTPWTPATKPAYSPAVTPAQSYGEYTDRPPWFIWDAETSMAAPTFFGDRANRQAKERAQPTHRVNRLRLLRMGLSYLFWRNVSQFATAARNYYATTPSTHVEPTADWRLTVSESQPWTPVDDLSNYLEDVGDILQHLARPPDPLPVYQYGPPAPMVFGQHHPWQPRPMAPAAPYDSFSQQLESMELPTTDIQQRASDAILDDIFVPGHEAPSDYGGLEIGADIHRFMDLRRGLGTRGPQIPGR